MDDAKVKQYVCLEKRKRDLDAELKQVEQDLKALERVVVNEMVNAGFNEVSADGRKLKLVPDVVASPVEDRWAVVEALKEAGLDQYIPQNYNDSQLRGFVKEIAAEVISRAQDEDRVASAEDVRAALPEPLGRALKVYLGHKLSSRKA
jgi:sugar-specific transcriptional regulator TrmB